MKTEYDYIPDLVTRAGSLTRLFFGFEAVTKTINEQEIIKYQGHNVDISGTIEYGRVVSAVIKEEYPDDRRDAIISNREIVRDNPEHEKAVEYTQEYEAFQGWRIYAKEIAIQVLALI